MIYARRKTAPDTFSVLEPLECGALGTRAQASLGRKVILSAHNSLKPAGADPLNFRVGGYTFGSPHLRMA